MTKIKFEKLIEKIKADNEQIVDDLKGSDFASLMVERLIHLNYNKGYLLSLYQHEDINEKQLLKGLEELSKAILPGVKK